MRFIGSKTKLLPDIAALVDAVADGRERVFCDLFAGSGAVSRQFKSRYQIIANDRLAFAHAGLQATIGLNRVPDFGALQAAGIADPLDYLASAPLPEVALGAPEAFVATHYAPHAGCQRMYLTPANARRIDFARSTLDRWRAAGLLDPGEFHYLLACVLAGVPHVSNITGTYGAYLKFWDARAHKTYAPERLTVSDNGRANACYWRDAAALIGELRGDILYLDPPYNNRQYVPNYHLLETIARYDAPAISGVTGMRPYPGEQSAYCSRKTALAALRDVVERANFRHIVVSYSSDGLIAAADLAALLGRCGMPGSLQVRHVGYRKYKSKIVAPDDRLHEYLFYVAKAGQP